MSINWIRDQANLLLMSKQCDCSEFDVSYDVALRPEIIGFLSGQSTVGQATGFIDHADKVSIVLDEHELAIG